MLQSISVLEAIRAGAEYREIICRVLTRRAVTQSLDICDEIKLEH